METAGITTPVKLTLHYTTDHYGSATKQEFEELQKQLNASGLFKVTIKGAPWTTFRPAEKEGEYDVYGMGWFPDFPDADNYLAPFLDKDNFLNLPYANAKIRDTPDPRVPPRGRPSDGLHEPHATSRTSWPTTYPFCRCGRATSTSQRATASPEPSGPSTPRPRSSSGSSAAV